MQSLQLLHHSHSNFLSLNRCRIPPISSPPAFPQSLSSDRDCLTSSLSFGSIRLNSIKMDSARYSLSNGHGDSSREAIALGLDDYDLDRFTDVGNQLADAAGDVIRRYFRKSFDILDKEDLSQFYLSLSFTLSLSHFLCVMLKCFVVFRIMIGCALH